MPASWISVDVGLIPAGDEHLSGNALVNSDHAATPLT